jgi:malonate decarboxylase epsilon subunit
MLACLFPGQGAQVPGFLHRLPAHAAVRATIDEASAVLGIDVSMLDTADALCSTVAVQVTLLTAGVAFARALEAEGLTIDAVSGLSVGAYPAAVACGALDFGDALRLVRCRAQLMERAYPSGYGLVAVLGLSETYVETLASSFDGRIHVANVNAPRQIVVAGDDAALADFSVRAREAGARKAERLAVSVPSHCVLLADAAEELAAFARTIRFARPRALYVDNRGARPLRDGAAIRDDLATNMRYTVRWFDAVTVLAEMGTRVFVEAPPAQMLTEINREAFADVIALAAAGSDLGNLVATIRARSH